MTDTPVFLTLEEVLAIHVDQIQRYGGSAGIRDRGLLESALAQPSAGIGEEYYHSDLFAMAAAYLYHIAQNHPFVDGNKRVGAVTALVFLDMNGVQLQMDQDALAEFVLEVADGKHDKEAVAERLRECKKKHDK